MIIGVGEVLKEVYFFIKIYVVELLDFLVLLGGKLGFYKIQGIGVGFVLDILNIEVYDEIFFVKNEEVFEYVCRVVCEEGIFGGILLGVVIYVVF